jgi:hypothetical protein
MRELWLTARSPIPAEITGFPATKITQVKRMIDPTTRHLDAIVRSEGTKSESGWDLGWRFDLTEVVVAEVRARFERYERALRLPSCETYGVYRGSRRHRNYPDIDISAFAEIAFEEIASGLHCYF